VYIAYRAMRKYNVRLMTKANLREAGTQSSRIFVREGELVAATERGIRALGSIGGEP